MHRFKIEIIYDKLISKSIRIEQVRLYNCSRRKKRDDAKSDIESAIQDRFSSAREEQAIDFESRETNLCDRILKTKKQKTKRG